MPPEEENKWVNWPAAFDYMQQVEDPVVKSLIRLVYDKVVRNDINGVRPAAPFDLLYCFRMLHAAFSCEPELHSALQGGNPSDDPPDWI